MATTRLHDISKAIGELADTREQERLELQEKLGEPIFFVPDLYTDGHGVGYFKNGPCQIFAYRKYSNGYERYPMAIYEQDFIERLARAFNE